jgi:hypothetical protein
MSTSGTTAQTGNRRRISARLGFALLSIIGTLVIIYFLTLWFGSVRGDEFAPDTFSRRAFSYYELPLIHLQVSPVRRIVRQNELCRHLTDTGLVTKTAAASRWDLVSASRGQRQLRDGDALILCRYLDARDSDGIQYWLRWTKQHPGLAKVLWPQVAQAAREELYVRIPEMFRAAWSMENPDHLQRNLKAIMEDNPQGSGELPAELPFDGGTQDASTL